MSSRIPSSLFLLSTILLSTTNRKGSISEPGSLPIGIARYIGDNPGSVAPGSVAPGSEPIAIAQYIEPNSGAGLQPIIPELPQDLIKILNSFMNLNRNSVLRDKLRKIDKIIDDNISNIDNLNAELKQFNILITSNNICINIEK